MSTHELDPKSPLDSVSGLRILRVLGTMPFGAIVGNAITYPRGAAKGLPGLGYLADWLETLNEVLEEHCEADRKRDEELAELKRDLAGAGRLLVRALELAKVHGDAV